MCLDLAFATMTTAHVLASMVVEALGEMPYGPSLKHVPIHFEVPQLPSGTCRYNLKPTSSGLALIHSGKKCYLLSPGCASPMPTPEPQGSEFLSNRFTRDLPFQKISPGSMRGSADASKHSFLHTSFPPR